jgi:hypothetical protein
MAPGDLAAAKKPTSGTSPSAWRTICSSAEGPPKCPPPRPVQLM